METDLFAVRSLLFLPASNPRAIEKARASAADLVILDLEDAVKPEDKLLARSAAVDALAADWPMPVAVRINGTHSEWYADDLRAVIACSAQIVVLPMVECGAEIEALMAVERPVMAMIESAAGVLAAPAIAQACVALIVGANDLSADLGLPAGAGRGPLQTALQMILLAARAGDAAAFDGVFNRLDDPDGLAAECAASRWLGFDGKCLIHPDQIAPCNQAFTPAEDEIARARRLVAASTGGAERFEDQMIEQMHVEAARRLLERARA
ncbi:MAG: CoA ester lyase [Pseudomonadota bacterium]|nr:CoA ester lyase [Pseudomonadota bacterium]